MPSNSFLGVFAKSPLKPLEDHINLVNECAQLLTPFFERVYQLDWAGAEEIRKEISKLEKQADEINRDLRTNLPSGLFMPINRQDILSLLTEQDKLANKAKDIAGRTIGRELQVPEALHQSFKEYLARCLEASNQAKTAINELDELLEAGFRGREVNLVEKMIEKLDAIEDDTDSLQIHLRKGLMNIEAQLNPVDVMFLYKTIEWVGELADVAERVGSRLEMMLPG